MSHPSPGTRPSPEIFLVVVPAGHSTLTARSFPLEAKEQDCSWFFVSSFLLFILSSILTSLGLVLLSIVVSLSSFFHKAVRKELLPLLTRHFVGVLRNQLNQIGF